MTTLHTAALQPQVSAPVRLAIAAAVALVLALAWAGAGRASHHAVESAQVAMSGAAPLLARQAPVVIVGRRETAGKRS